MEFIKNIKNIHLWILVIVLTFVLRVFALNLNPVGISHDDELHEILNAKSMALTGLENPGTIAGIFTQNDSCSGNCVYGEMGSFILIPWMWIFPLSLFWAKIPFVLVSVCLVFFTGKLFENFSKNSRVGLLVALAVATNPWAIHFGRTAYFTTFSYLFYIIGLYFFTRKNFFKSNLILGITMSAMGSMFYFGTKPILPFIILWGIAYNSISLKLQNIKFTLSLFIIVSLLIGSYFIFLSHSYAGRRLNEINQFTPGEIAAEVNNQRQSSLDIPLVRDLIINKYTVNMNIRIEKYIGFFSPTFLFLKSAGSTNIYYDSNHGYYYFIDLFFLIFGVIAIFRSLRIGVFILSAVALSVIPAAIKTTGDTVYALRTALAYPLISGVIGWGIFYFCQTILSVKQLTIKKLNFAKIIITFVVLAYLISLGNFLIMYWYRNPIDKNIGWYFHKRVLSNYISRIVNSTNKKVIIVTAQPVDTFNTYVFFSNLYNSKSSILEINKVYKTGNYEYQGVKFVNNCTQLTANDLKTSTLFIEQTIDCSINQNNTNKIANPKDGGGMYSIINDSLCAKFKLARYPYPRTIDQFNVEGMDLKTFCSTWITNPDQPI